MSSWRPHLSSTWVRPLLVPALFALFALVGLTLAGCTGDDTSTSDPTATTSPVLPAEPVDDPLAFTAYTDPAVPIVAAVGERFVLLLDAEPSEGYRWEVVAAPDPAVAMPLGSQFLPRDSIPATTTTTTTASPPPLPEPVPPEGPAPPAEDSTTDETATPPVPAEPTLAPTTTVPTRSVQVLSYVGRAPGRTSVTLRYIRVGQPPDASTPTMTFTIEVLGPPPPTATP